MCSAVLWKAQATSFETLEMQLPQLPAFSESVGYGYDLETSWDGKANNPFFVSVNVPDGNYRALMLEGNAPLMDRSKALACVGYIEEARRDILGNVRHVYAVRNLLLKIGG